MPEAIDPILHSRHDLFNIVALPVIVYYLLNFLLAYSTNKDASFTEVCAIGEVYFLVDTVWLLMYPRSVSSPRIIIAHHCLAAVGWYCPMWEPATAGYCAACLLVEINTFFLIAKRYFSDISLLKVPLKICFHITWIIFRVVMYPAIVYFFTFEAIAHTKRVNNTLNVFTLGWVLVTGLTLLNFKWTSDLYLGKAPSTARKGL